MGDKSTIGWTDATWNPLVGCSRVSAGCEHCYAERLVHRGLSPQHRGLTKVVNGTPHWTGEVRLVESALDLPLRWTKPRRIFVNSLSDLFHEKMPDEWIDRIFCVMAWEQQHTYQVLTKRPERMLAYMQGMARLGRREIAIRLARAGSPVHIPNSTPTSGLILPLPNVWLGVSVEDQATADERIPLLLQTPAAVRWVSYEPALAPVDLGPWLEMEHCQSCKRPYPDIWSADHASWNRVIGGEGGLRCIPCFYSEAAIADVIPTVTIHGKVPSLDWLVIGGESGPGARFCFVDWIRSAVAQGQAAHVPVFVKQLGPHLHLSDRKGADPAEWPEDLRVQEYPQ